MGVLITVDGTAADVQDLMGEVAECLARWEAGPARRLAEPGATQASYAQVDALVQGLRLKARVNGDAIIHSTRPRLGPAVIRFQTVVRRLTWWFLEPILHQIRAFETDAALALAALVQEQRALQAEVADLRATLERLALPARDAVEDSTDVPGGRGLCGS